jgi:hypothetical protein
LRLDEAIDGEMVLPRVVEDGQLLVGQILGTRRKNSGRVASGDCSPEAPTDPDLPN